MRKKTVEEYIEIIHALEVREGRAATGKIAVEMRVKPSSATEMLKKLRKEGLLQYETYAGATLTDSGRRLALELNSKHKAIADFLEIIGVDRCVAERDACQMEHHVGQETMEKLERFVQFAGLSSFEPLWVENFKRYCETGQGGECNLCTRLDSAKHSSRTASALLRSKKNAMLDINYLSLASAMHRLTGPAIRSALSALEIVPGSLGLDAACGNGDHSIWLAEAVSPHGRIIGLDICREGLFRARASSARAGLADRLTFLQGDLRCLPFEDHAFDWAWCADSLWPGPQSLGFLGMDPLPILRELVRVVRPGGLIAILFWSSQRLLPGHPFLEARLNATRAASYPFQEAWGTRAHILSAPLWLGEAGLKEIRGRTFAADVQAPTDGRTRDDLAACFQMLWGKAAEELSDGDRKQFERLCLQESPDFIAGRPEYYAFITYTLFTGRAATCHE